MISWNEFIERLERSAKEIEWDLVGLQNDKGELVDFPVKSTFVTAVIEEMVSTQLVEVFDDLGITHERGGDREYPDLTLYDGALEDKLVALDIKTCRIHGPDKISGFTLGSRAGYFKNPHKKERGCRRPYADFTKHLIVGFIYEWNPDQKGKAMVIIQHSIVAEKWQLASKTTGTGTTKHIGSVKSLESIMKKEGAFVSMEEFEKYWRDYDK